MIVRKPIVVVGSINMDLVANAERIPLAGETVASDRFQTFQGGKGANQAVAIAKLGYPVQLIGRLGLDHFGEELQESLRQAGVDIAGVKKISGSSGIALIVVSRQGENCIVVTPGANAQLMPEDLDEYVDQIRLAGAVLAQLETPLKTIERLAEICLQQGVPFILDPAPAQDLPVELIRKITWFTPNETEADFYLGNSQVSKDGMRNSADVVQGLLSLGARNVLLKRGERGFHLATSEGLDVAHPAYSVKAVDTTAAGDAFNGAFAMALVTGKSPVESARFASAAAAASVTRNGAQPSMPTYEEVDQLLSAASCS